MHELNFALLKDWLPVGVSAILFFGIGLLLAKFIWGRYNQRLANAIEENMALAGQWSSLGASQQDLFKKLRVRWQADRDAYEAAIAEKELKIALLGERIKVGGGSLASVDAASEEVFAARARIGELESALESERAEAAKLRGELDKVAEMPILPFAVKEKAAAEVEVEAPESRLRELEQDLTDTRDELHRVRADYEKQLALVESLEARLIAVPEPVAEPQADPELHQLRALLSVRGRELRRSREEFVQTRIASLEAHRDELASRAAELAAKSEEVVSKEAELAAKDEEIVAKEAALAAKVEEVASKVEEIAAKDEEIVSKEAELAAKEAEIVAKGEEIVSKEAEIVAKNEEIASRDLEIAARRAEIESLADALRVKEEELAEANTKLEDLELLRRRRAALQAELNDACHELYDVRRSLNVRIGEIRGLEEQVGRLSGVESANAGLARSLEKLRDELAASIATLALTEASRDDAAAEAAELRAALEGELDQVKLELSAERDAVVALSGQLNDARRELSETRISFAAKSEDHAKAMGQLEELEAIIEDRTAEVDDLSAELRQQRDQMRQMRETLAEKQGELEALGEESQRLNASTKARAAYVEEQRLRIGDLESALTDRYRELNQARVDAERFGRDVKYFESRANQLEAELERRSAEFVASGQRVIDTEEALEAANAKISALSDQLEQSEASIGELRSELDRVSREKDETLRDLDRTSQRVSELEEAARKREEQLAEIERELLDARNESSSLQQEADRVRAELEEAREERSQFGVSFAELEIVAKQREIALLDLEQGMKEMRAETTRLQERAERLQVELESAREEHRLSSVAVSELEEALRSGDERTLELSARLDEKEGEAARLVEELSALQAALDERTAAEAEAQVRLSALESEMEAKLADLRRQQEEAGENFSRDLAKQEEEILALRGQLDAQSARLSEEEAQRQAHLSEIEALREKLAARTESIRDLQNQISGVMMQRASRDTEIALLKEKLRAIEEGNQTLAAEVVSKTAEAPVEPEAPVVLGDDEMISLDDLPHTPAAPEPEPVPVAVETPKPVEESTSSKWTGQDEDLTVFFNESAAALNRAEMEKIDRSAKSIRRLGRKVEVTVIGYAGSEGNPDHAETLSARRADAVRERLLERGVAQAVVKVRAAGQDRRFTDWKARRVEMVLSPVAVAEAVN